MEDIHLTKKQFQQLSQEVFKKINKYSWLELHGYELVIFFLRIAGFIAGFFIFSISTQDSTLIQMIIKIILKMIGITLMCYCYSGIVITGTHETSHGSFFRSKQMNKYFSYFFTDFLAGQSSRWWHWRHVQVHHAETNVKDKDPPLFIYNWMNKYIYFFIIPYLLGFWFIYNSISYLLKKPLQLCLYLLLTILGYAANIYLFTLVLPLIQAIIAMFFMRFLFAPIFMQIAVFNHIALEEPVKKYPWLKHQTRTTRNLKNNWFIRGFGGNAFVDAHIDHHLFPALSNNILTKIQPIIKKYLKRYGYTYHEEGYLYCINKCLEYYESYFKGNDCINIEK